MIWAAITAGFAAGLIHVLSGPDHLAAVAPFAIGRRARSWRAGLQWGLGHCVGVMLIGLLALFFRESLPLDSIPSSAERFVGLVLIGVGVWGICKSLTAKKKSPEGETPNAPLAIGAVHGLAGSSHLLGVIPGLLFPGAGAVCAYFLGFAGGTIAAMTAFSCALGSLPGRIYRPAMTVCSCAAVAIGGYWLIA